MIVMLLDASATSYITAARLEIPKLMVFVQHLGYFKMKIITLPITGLKLYQSQTLPFGAQLFMISEYDGV